MAKIKLAMCWDDGPTTDIRLISILRKLGISATFNLNPGLIPQYTPAPTWAKPGENGNFIPGKVGMHDLKALYSDFPVASHCWKHEDPRTFPAEAVTEAAVHARTWLEDFFEKPCPGFAYPFGATTPELTAMLKQAGFRYGRLVGTVASFEQNSDPLATIPNAHFLDRDFYAKFTRAKEAGSSAFYFWGHSYETMNYEMLWQLFEDRLVWLSNDPDTEWVDVLDLFPEKA